MEASLQSAGGANNTVWFLSWYVDKKNTVELLMKDATYSWILKERAGGSIVAKAKGFKTIDPNTPYIVRLVFDGAKFQVFVDDLVTPLMTLTPATAFPAGTVGFQVKNNIGRFDYVTVE